MPVIEAQCASILVPHDHRHINHVRMSAPGAARHKYTAGHHGLMISCSRKAGMTAPRLLDNRAPTRLDSRQAGSP
jgi:hypothetical protein